MGTGINYLDEVWNPVTGCQGKNCPTKDTCWARAWVKWRPAIHGCYNYDDPRGREKGPYPIHLGRYPIPFHKVQFHPDRLEKPLHWKKPRRIGACFMGDLFDEQAHRDWFLRIILVIRRCPQHIFFFLTKQVDRMVRLATEWVRPSETLADMTLQIKELPENIYWGVSITSQVDADRMIPELLRIPGRRWISWEPALGPVDFLAVPAGSVPGYAGLRFSDMIHWIIMGTESGTKRRPCPHKWMIDAVKQCRATKVPVWVKQIEIEGKVCTDITKFPKELQVRELP